MIPPIEELHVTSAITTIRAESPFQSIARTPAKSGSSATSAQFEIGGGAAWHGGKLRTMSFSTSCLILLAPRAGSSRKKTAKSSEPLALLLPLMKKAFESGDQTTSFPTLATGWT